MLVLGPGSEAEMIACFLGAELASTASCSASSPTRSPGPLEGHLRLTGYALAGFPAAVECLLGTAPDMGRWAQ
jgi:hypothetical protein